VLKMLAIITASLLHAGSTSSNWAGYAVSGATFTDVKGTWVQPAVTCAAAGSTYAAFWVGLGGMVDNNGGLEQTGTESDCEDGMPSYRAWYELLPAAAVTVPVAIAPGDTVSAEVSADGAVATLTLTDVTTGQTFSTQATPATLDTSSAEWIAEAPSRCFGSHCLPLRLANFGTVQFSGSTTTANGHVGTISDATWSAMSIELGGNAGAAVPAALSDDGSGFSVMFTTPQPQVQPQKPAPKPKAKPKPKKKPMPKRHRHPAT
jgi:peptidase A4-like protein